MVFESLTDPKEAERQPWEMFFVGILYSSLAIMIALWIFKEHASLVMIFLTVLASVHLMYVVIKYEERKDLKIGSERKLLREHGKALSLFMFLFMGFVVSFSAWYILLPESTSAHLFSTQLSTIQDINTQSVHIGNAISTSKLFFEIFGNNMKVLVLCTFFAFFYGVGAIFILAWNASVVGAAVGKFAHSLGGATLSTYMFGIMRYFTHGIPEMLAYFAAGLGGGIISIAIIKHDFGSHKFKRILLDSADLIVGATFILFIAALIEVFVTPLLF